MLSLASINIEGNNHLQEVLGFLEVNNPDVICLQELFEVDLHHFAKSYPHIVFIPTTNIVKPNSFRLPPIGKMGVGILSRLPFLSSNHHYYVQSNILPQVEDGLPNNSDRVLLIVEVEKDARTYKIVTTHFTWSPGASVTQDQRDNSSKMLSILSDEGEFVFCGDFNAARGREIFDKIASVYVDNIPQEITTTIDQKLHRVSGIQFVVDGLFTTPSYHVIQAKVESGVSDHCAIFTTLERD